jgi:hypothetical protein
MEFKWHIPGCISQNLEKRAAINKQIFNNVLTALKNNNSGVFVFINFDELLTVSFPGKNVEAKTIDNIHQIIEDSLYFFKLDPFIPLNKKFGANWESSI